MALPAWLASTTQVPTAVKEMAPAESAQPAVLDGSMLKITEFPDAPLVAVGVYVAPPTTASAGAVLVKVMVCDPLPTENDC